MEKFFQRGNLPKGIATLHKHSTGREAQHPSTYAHTHTYIHLTHIHYNIMIT